MNFKNKREIDSVGREIDIFTNMYFINLGVLSKSVHIYYEQNRTFSIPVKEATRQK